MRSTIVPIFLLTIGVPHLLYADETKTTEFHSIQLIKVFDNRIEVQLPQKSECGPEVVVADHYRAFSGDPNYDAKAALLLTAYANRNRVQITYRCEGDSARIRGIRGAPGG